MPAVNPSPSFNFEVYMFDSASAGGDARTVFGSVVADLGKTIVFGQFSEVNGLSQEMEVEEYREGGRNTAPHKFLKYGKYPLLTLKRGVTFNTELADWHYQVVHGSGAPRRRDGVVILYDRGGAVPGGSQLPINIPGLDRTPIGIWFFRKGLPEKVQGPNLNAKSNEIAVETLEIAHEGILRVGLGMIPGAGDAFAAVGL
jgi:phage tail-like protein